MIDELTIQKIKCYDNRFGTKSRVFPSTDKVLVETPLDEWMLQITNKKNKGICLYHRNRRGRINKFHVQGFKTNLYQVYDSIYRHKGCLCVLNSLGNTYTKGIMNEKE